jgi:hypothetical protein
MGFNSAFKGLIKHCITEMHGRVDVLEVKGRAQRRTGCEDPVGEHRPSSTFYLTSALDRGEWSMPRRGRSTPENDTQYPFYWRLFGPVWRGVESWLELQVVSSSFYVHGCEASDSRSVRHSVGKILIYPTCGVRGGWAPDGV